jgi:putative pyruvate formate lyase activating enzyme
MNERVYNISISPDGGLNVTDPDFDFSLLLPEGFKIHSQPPHSSFVPKLQIIRRIGVLGVPWENLSRIDTPRLWEIHDRLLSEGISSSVASEELTLLDLKIELAKREIENCRLCGWMCSVNRFIQKGPYCGLKAEAFYNSIIAHIAEESVITPCIMIKLSGCSIRCKTCNAAECLNPEQGQMLDYSVWNEVRKVNGYEKGIALQFFGGNPDESVFSILGILKSLPGDFGKPIVWNNNGYANPVLYRLLHGIVDVWLTDFKYGNNLCGQTISGVLDYPEIASQGIEQIIKQDARIIIRILVLPGHVDCCYKNILEWLSNYKDKIFVSLIDNYIPTGEALWDTHLNQMVPDEEIARIRDLIAYYGLRDIWDNEKDFWR